LFVRDFPYAVQKVRDFEQEMCALLANQQWERITAEAFRWHPVLLARNAMCFEHPETEASLRKRVEEALGWADGIALDGFGFMNSYACFCDRCNAIRAEMKAKEPDRPDLDILEEMSTQTLVTVHAKLYAHARSINPRAIVTDHVWPPFRPDPYIGRTFKLDFCTQTISWFYPPEWRLERVEFEAAEMKRLEDRAINQFVPFIGIYDHAGHVRPPERLARELEIALKYGEGHIVVSRLTTLQQHPFLADAVKSLLK
jgi:hypothetical protein